MNFVADCVATGAQLANVPSRLPDIVTACIQAEAARRAGKLAAGAATTAATSAAIGALLQALAVTFVGWLAVGQWHREAQGRRKMEVAEGCAQALGGLISAIQTFRSPNAVDAEEQQPSAGTGQDNPFERLYAAIARTQDRRRKDMDAALRKFQESYSAAKLRIDFLREDDRDEISNRCDELRQLQLQIEPFIMQKLKGPELIGKFHRFHGTLLESEPDTIGEQVSAIESRMMTVLQAVLRPPSLWIRFKRVVKKLVARRA